MAAEPSNLFQLSTDFVADLGGGSVQQRAVVRMTAPANVPQVHSLLLAGSRDGKAWFGGQSSIRSTESLMAVETNL